jgi:putative metallohydrolase (TIGR04338 family)
MAAPAQPRDAQRSRVYRAETPLGGRRLPMLPDCAAFVDDVVGSLWWVARFPEHDLAKAPILRPGNGARQAFYREDPGHPTITLPRRYRTVGVVLHELVHWALADAHDLPNHGRTFTRILLDATAEFMGTAKRERLAAAYTEHKVAVAPPPRVGPAGAYDYGWDERLRLGRGRRFVVDYDTEASACGMLVSRAHKRVTLEDGIDLHVIPERSIWRVRAARNGRTAR